MQLEFHSSSCPYLSRNVWEVQRREQTQEIRLPDGMPDVGRVLGAWGQAVLRGKEWHSGGMSVSGGVTAWVVYLPEDGSGPQSVEAWLPFQAEWSFPDSRREGTIRVGCLLHGVDARTVSARKIMVRAGVSLLGEALEEAEATIYQPDAVEGVELLRRTYPAKLPREAGEKSFLIDEELTIPGGAAAEKLIAYDVLPQLAEQKVLGGQLVFRGSIQVHLLYQDKDAVLHSCELEVPLSQYADLERDYDKEATADVMTAVSSLEPELAGDHLRLKCGLIAQYVVCEQVVLTVVEDAYSPSRTVEPVMEELTLPAILDVSDETVRVEQAAQAAGDRILDVAFYPDDPAVRRAGADVEMEASGTFQVVYYDAEGALQSVNARGSAQWTLPAAEETAMLVCAQLQSRPQAAMAAGQLSMRCELGLRAVAVSRQGIRTVTGAEVGEETEADPNRPSLILRKSDEQGLWALAKRCGSTVDAIKKANGLQGEPTQGQMLLIPIP